MKVLNGGIKMYEVFCGSAKAMLKIMEIGAKGLNPKTRKFQIIDKKARYKVRIDKIIEADELHQKKYGEKHIKLATLLSDKDLRKIAEEKGLIL